MPGKRLFDDWPERYDAWFTTPMGSLILEYEQDLIGDLLQPGRNELLLDAGCGTGVFTRAFLDRGAKVTGLDISVPMLIQAQEKLRECPFEAVAGDMLLLPFADAVFDKAVSVTALEFISNARAVVGELFRVVKQGGCIVVATLNSLSTWAAHRKAEAVNDDNSVFKAAVFRSPAQIRALAPVEGVIRTAIHFQEIDDPEKMREIESEGRLHDRDTGAFLAARWIKPL